MTWRARRWAWDPIGGTSEKMLNLALDAEESIVIP